MKIGELAQLSGLEPSAIRYYESLGLIIAPERTQAGYRMYDNSALERLALIKVGQDIGFTLADLAALLNEQREKLSDEQHQVILDSLNQKRESYAVEIELLQHKQMFVGQLIDGLEKTWQQGECFKLEALRHLLEKTQ